MKYILILIITFCFSASFAQDVMVLGGTNWSSQVQRVVNEKATFDEWTMGYTLGASGEYTLNRNFSFQGGLLFLSKSFSDSTSFYDRETTLHMVELPLTARCTFGRSVLRPYIGLGFFFSYSYYGVASLEGGDDSSDFSSKQRVTFGKADSDDIKAFDYGLLFCTGIEYKKWELNGVFELGFNDFSENDFGISHTNSRAFRLTLAYQVFSFAESSD